MDFFNDPQNKEEDLINQLEQADNMDDDNQFDDLEKEFAANMGGQKK